MFENTFNSELRERIQKYTVFDAQSFKDIMIGDMDIIDKYMLETILHQQEIQKLLTEKKLLQIDTGKALDVDLVVTESSRIESKVQDESSRLGNDTNTNDADIRPIYDEEPMVEVQLTSKCNIFAIGQQHTEQPKIINEGRVDQYTEQCQVKIHMIDSSLYNKTTEFSNQSLESENICLKKIVAQFQKDFSRMEAHCIALELKYQNQALKSRQHGQFFNGKSNNA
ncbi:hypothetical protein Tco_1025585 [Tanacetum coccineum]